MAESLKSLGAWLTFAGCVLVVGVLYWAQAVLVPVALAILLTFVLTPPTLWLQRYLGRVPAVLAVVILVFSFLGLGSYGVYRQMSALGDALPGYRGNIREKISDIRGVRSGGSVGKIEETLTQIQGDLGTPQPRRGTTTQPVVVTTDQVPGFSSIGWLGPLVEPLSNAAFVITLVLFMLLEREDLRDRMVGLFGHGQLAVTTRAMSEAGERVSRQLLLQTLVNLIYGALVTVGLFLLGVPYPLFWGAAGAALRFIPYVGPLAAAGGPILLSLAALPGWIRPLEVVAFFAALELFTNLVLETVLYAGAAGVSQVALLIAVAFWTWLWGPLGLLMATPLTVCLVVIGKHVSALEFLGTLLSDAPALTSEKSFYQRLLARDPAEASELVDRFVKANNADDVYDGMFVPALTYAERDRVEDRLSPEEESAVIDTAREMLAMLETSGPATVAPSPARLRVVGYAANGPSDEIALQMLGQLVRTLPIALEATSGRLMASELIELVRERNVTAICIADLPPSAPSKTRYLVKKLRAALPDVRIVVGRWAPAEIADESLQPILDAGASHVTTRLIETRRYLAEISQTVALASSTSDAA